MDGCFACRTTAFLRKKLKKCTTAGLKELRFSRRCVTAAAAAATAAAAAAAEFEADLDGVAGGVKATDVLVVVVMEGVEVEGVALEGGRNERLPETLGTAGSGVAGCSSSSSLSSPSVG